MSYIFLVFSLFVVSCESGTNYSHAGDCADWAEITVGEYIVQNNVWNKQDITYYEQCIYKQSQATDFPFGWHWTWPEPPGGVKAYPEIIFGYKPWNSSSTTPALPIQLLAISGITAAYDINQTATGSYNLAFDIWLNSKNPPDSGSITREIMIWLDHEGMVPAGNYIDTVTINSEAYAFYMGDVNTGSWTYIAFVKQTAEYSGDTKIDLFFDYLVSNGYIADTAYCSSIELGNEVVEGSGSTEFADYSVTVN